MLATTLLPVVVTALAGARIAAADSGGCTNFAIQTTQEACAQGRPGNDPQISDSDQAQCTDGNWDFISDWWSDQPSVDQRINDSPYSRPDSFSGSFRCDNSNPTLNFYRSGDGYNVYCAGGDGSVKTYAGDRDDLYDAPDGDKCHTWWWHWAYVEGFNPCWC